MIILLSGTPGTGKTSVASVLETLLSCSLIGSSQLLRETGQVLPDYTGRYTGVILDEAISNGSEKLVEISRRRCVIFETVYPADWLMIEDVNLEVALIVLLRTHPFTLFERLQGKGWPEEKVIENVLAEAFNVIAEQLLPWEYDVIEVDTTQLSPQEAAEAILDGVMEWETGIRIDWLSDPVVQEEIPRLLSRLDTDKYRLGV